MTTCWRRKKIHLLPHYTHNLPLFFFLKQAPRFSVIGSSMLQSTRFKPLPTEFAVIGRDDRNLLVVSWLNPMYRRYSVNLGAVMNRGAYCVCKHQVCSLSITQYKVNLLYHYISTFSGIHARDQSVHTLFVHGTSTLGSVGRGIGWRSGWNRESIELATGAHLHTYRIVMLIGLLMPVTYF